MADLEDSCGNKRGFFCVPSGPGGGLGIIAWSEVAEYSLAQGAMLVWELCGTVVLCGAISLYEYLVAGALRLTARK